MAEMCTVDFHAVISLNFLCFISHSFLSCLFSQPLLDCSQQVWSRFMKHLWSERFTLFNYVTSSSKMDELRYIFNTCIKLQNVILYSLALNKAWLTGLSRQIQELCFMTRIICFFNFNRLLWSLQNIERLEPCNTIATTCVWIIGISL